MNKWIYLVSVILMCGTSCGSETTSEEVIQTNTCDATNVESAVECICNYYDQLDSSEDLSDEEYNELYDKIDTFNAEIDKAIAEEKYTVDELYDQADKINCRL